MKRLLIAYDGSPAADEAINDLLYATLPAQLDVTVMSVADVYLPPTSRLPEAAVPELLVLQKAREKALQEVAAHQQKAESRPCAKPEAVIMKAE